MVSLKYNITMGCISCKPRLLTVEDDVIAKRRRISAPRALLPDERLTINTLDLVLLTRRRRRTMRSSRRRKATFKPNLNTIEEEFEEEDVENLP